VGAASTLRPLDWQRFAHGKNLIVSIMCWYCFLVAKFLTFTPVVFYEKIY
jgi:hypothetical protein